MASSSVPIKLMLFSVNVICYYCKLQVPRSLQSGQASIKFIEYHDISSTCDPYSQCDFFFNRIEVYDSNGNVLVFVNKTSATSLNTPTFELQKVPELQGEFQFDLETNTTMKMRFEVWDEDDLNAHDLIRTITGLAMRFNAITPSSTWTNKRFILSNPYGYLDIQLKLSCKGHFGGIGCNYCSDHYYNSSCSKYCKPVPGNYTCDAEGDNVCVEHTTGVNCETCTKGWAGPKCQECAEHYYPEGICTVSCKPEDSRYSCSTEGEKVCLENWQGVNCSSCADNFYPDGVCDVECTGVQGRFTCLEDGGRVCSVNWRGAECNQCAAGHFGDVCGVVCAPTAQYYCSGIGERRCRDNTTTIDNNCEGEDSDNVLVKVLLASGGIVIVVIILAVFLVFVRVLKRKRRRVILVEPLEFSF